MGDGRATTDDAIEHPYREPPPILPPYLVLGGFIFMHDGFTRISDLSYAVPNSSGGMNIYVKGVDRFAFSMSMEEYVLFVNALRNNLNLHPDLRNR